MLLFALTVSVIGVMMGAAIEYARGSDAQVKIQTALDAAVLAGAKTISGGENDPAKVKKIAEDTFYANISESLSIFSDVPIVSFTIDPVVAGIEGQASGSVGQVFALLSGGQETGVGANSTAGFGVLDIELAMMLDVTGSMRGQKIVDLRNAASRVVDILIGDDAPTSTRNTTRIALVPYSGSVNGGDYARDASGGASGRCVTERSGAQRYTDAAPIGAPVGSNRRARCPRVAVVGLSKDATSLKDKIKDFSADGSTAGHIGVAWSYYALSPNWDGIWPRESEPASYDTKRTMKIALLMTDGKFNTFYDGLRDTNGRTATRKSNQATERLCDSMRDSGIVIYSVAFNAPRSAETLLRDCAGIDSRYHEAETSGEFLAAFEQIAGSIRDLRLTR